MARNLVHSLAEKLWQTSPPRNHMPARWAALEDGIIRKELSKHAKYVCFDIFNVYLQYERKY